MARGSRISRVLDFFRNGDKDEVKAVLFIIAEEELTDRLEVEPTRRRRSRRLNGSDNATESNDNAKGATA